MSKNFAHSTRQTAIQTRWLSLLKHTRQALLAAGVVTLAAGMLYTYPTVPAHAALQEGGDQPIDATGTDNYVNAFIKKQYAMGFKNVMATGSWWGDVNLAAKNQQWVVVRDHQLGKVFPFGSPITAEFTCLYPGKLPNTGYSPNTISLHKMRLQLGGDEAFYLSEYDKAPLKPPVIEQFYNVYVTPSAKRTQPTAIELRADCLGQTTELDPMIGTKENQNTNFDSIIYYGGKTAAPENHLNVANLNGSKATEELIDVHAWYNGTDYVYGVLKNTRELVGKPLSGVIKVVGYAEKPDSKATIHHFGVKYENGDNEDRWVSEDVHQPMDMPMPVGYNKNCTAALPGSNATVGKYCPITIAFDTRKVCDGVHILSWHIHAIENTAVTRLPSHTGKQLAAEIKFPICVDNNNSGVCK
jgi:hypothetical protein